MALSTLSSHVLRREGKGELARASCDRSGPPASAAHAEMPCRRAAYSVHTAENGARGLELAKALKPAVITLDVMMPEMDGFEFMDALRQRQDGRDIPVVVITARQLSEEDRRRLNGQVVQIIPKSQTTAEEVLAEVRHLMREEAEGESKGDDHS